MTLRENAQTVHSQRASSSRRSGGESRGSTSSVGRVRSTDSSSPSSSSASPSKERRDLHVLESMYGKARHHDHVVVGCAVTYFRAQALRDANHPDFLGEWI